jgi:hypothetical protein
MKAEMQGRMLEMCSNHHIECRESNVTSMKLAESMIVRQHEAQETDRAAASRLQHLTMLSTAYQTFQEPNAHQREMFSEFGKAINGRNSTNDCSQSDKGPPQRNLPSLLISQQHQSLLAITTNTQSKILFLGSKGESSKYFSCDELPMKKKQKKPQLLKQHGSFVSYNAHSTLCKK